MKDCYVCGEPTKYPLIKVVNSQQREVQECISCYIKDHQDNMEYIKAWYTKQKKQCTKCHKLILVNEKNFALNPSKQYGVENICKMCSKDIRATYRHTRRARLKATATNYKQEYWKAALKHFNYACAYCGCKQERFQRDHVIPVAKGGGNTKNNIVPTCKRCNTSKNINDFELWYKSKPFFDDDRYNTILDWINERP
jgi:hypothetical protein